MKKIIAMLCLAALPLAGQADEISGDWCSPTGAHVRFEGNTVLTPGGQVTDGIYSRHAFEFIIPEGEKDAGLIFMMRQLSEMQSIVLIEGREPEGWQRCQLTS